MSDTGLYHMLVQWSLVSLHDHAWGHVARVYQPFLNDEALMLLACPLPRSQWHETRPSHNIRCLDKIHISVCFVWFRAVYYLKNVPFQYNNIYFFHFLPAWFVVTSFPPDVKSMPDFSSVILLILTNCDSYKALWIIYLIPLIFPLCLYFHAFFACRSWFLIR